MIRLLHVEPNTVMRLMLKELLAVEDLEIVGSVARLAELEPARIEELAPDLLMVSVNDTDNSFERIRLWRDRNPSLRIVAVLDDCSPDRLIKAVQSGIDGLVLTDQAPAEISRCVMLVAMGEKVFPPEATEVLARIANAEPPAEGRPGRALTGTEKLLLGYLRAGCSNMQIATFTRLDEGEVKVLVHSIFRKLKVRNRTQAALWAARNPHLIFTPEQFAVVRQRSAG
ncbi:LuxR C-terminal-related transcriptional regulator [Arenibaculum pallidiluteum]|uniref:LuxR C-terminal-related transcriptional regulator n=1 Tax=Arenibaculum pallidiluteum TaxID=2812559 RepID=UPI001A9674D8|nr:response regulator transcription factor [Arenibaculum pallidiluteum]